MDTFSKNLFFNAFTIVFIFADNSFWRCRSLQGKLLNIVHQYICSLILLLGPLYGHYKANVILMTGVLLGWTMTGRCFISVMTNKFCKHKESSPFRNLQFHLKEATIPLFGIEKDNEMWATVIDYVILIMLIIYNVYMAKIIRLKFYS